MKALFPYAGSTKRHADFIAALIREEGFKTYAEPMFGSGAVFLTLQPPEAFISDTNVLHVNLYQVIAMEERRQTMIDTMSEFEPTKDEFKRQMEYVSRPIIYEVPTAAAWYFLLTACYNGILRYSGDKPHFTTGFRLETWHLDWPKYARWLSVQGPLLARADIRCGDYSQCPEADMAFFDPPWAGSSVDYGGNFDHHRLADYLDGYSGKWVLTVNDEARDVYLSIAPWYYELTPRYQTSSERSGRGRRKELLICNFIPAMFGG